MKVLKHDEMAGVSRRWKCSIPACPVCVSLKVGIVQAVIGAIVAEWMRQKAGVAGILDVRFAHGDTPMLLAGIIVTIVLGIVTYQAVIAF